MCRIVLKPYCSVLQKRLSANVSSEVLLRFCTCSLLLPRKVSMYSLLWHIMCSCAPRKLGPLLETELFSSTDLFRFDSTFTSTPSVVSMSQILPHVTS